MQELLKKGQEEKLTVNPSTCCVLHEEAAVEDFETGSLVLLCEQLRLIELNRVARGVVGLLDGRRAAGEIAEVLAEQYDAPLDVVLADVAELLADLEARGVVTRRMAGNVQDGDNLPERDPGGVGSDWFALHASAATTPEGALLFLGHGGAGKSTVVGQLAGWYPTLADDAVWLFRDGNGAWRVADASITAFARPPTLDEVEAKSPGVALRAVFRLFHADEPRIVPLDLQQTCRYLADALFEVVPQRRESALRKREWFAGIADLARRYPGAELYFNLDARRAWSALQAYLDLSAPTGV